MEQAISISTPSRCALLSRSAVLTAAGALAACVPTLAPAAEPGANRELARLCAQALACRDAAELPYEGATTAEQEDRIQPEVQKLSDQRIDAMTAAAEVPLRTAADRRLAARTILSLAFIDEDGDIDPNTYQAELGPLTSSLIKAIAAGARA
jgi:hypothetical protein